MGGLEINKTKISATSTTYSHGQHSYGNFSKRMKGVKYLSYLEKSSSKLSLIKVTQQTLKTGVPRQENRVRHKILKGKITEVLLRLLFSNNSNIEGSTLRNYWDKDSKGFQEAEEGIKLLMIFNNFYKNEEKNTLSPIFTLNYFVFQL